LEEARERYERALALFRAVRRRASRRSYLQAEPRQDGFEQADFEAALKNLEDALPRYQQLMDVRGEAECVKGLGDIALKNFKYQVANANMKRRLVSFVK
jgi:tetratricopeptide (TPR) repeat protein